MIIFKGPGDVKDLAVGLNGISLDLQSAPVALARSAFHAAGIDLELDQGNGRNFITGGRRTDAAHAPALTIIVGKRPD
ncbi:MAG: hypothetical protein ACRD9L_20235, partial [Bryobacteraceae bacterium]